jgi:AraC family transcriptional regulator, regulatory protein of adaptative response / DNA-3-methyladenine glycosylase II
VPDGFDQAVRLLGQRTPRHVASRHDEVRLLGGEVVQHGSERDRIPVDVGDNRDSGRLNAGRRHGARITRAFLAVRTLPATSARASEYGRQGGLVTGISGWMKPFAAVVTTGIYCRPGCSARPNQENVERFGLAAAAEAAGFRACLRCRPYRAADLVFWSGPELVCRAVQMILDGALDRDTESTLAGRLSVSARHLRRLFTTHLGVTPDGLARSARAHFARRLLDDTDLTIVEVALTAGFGSVRQFNRACADIFRAPPGELRARRRVSDRLVADGGLALKLPFGGPLDWDALVSYLGARAIPGVEYVAGGTYRRTIVTGCHPGVLELRPGGDDYLVLVAHLPHWEELIHIAQRARRIPGLELDLDEATEHLGRDPRIGPVVRARPGIRVPGTWDAFETGVRAIIGQQISIAAANTIAGRLVERLGTPVPGLDGLGLTHAFPSAETLADTELDGLGLSRGRADSIRLFARAVVDDDVRLDRSVELDHLVESITAIPGLGQWTANYVALRLGERDAFPASDLGLRRALGEPAAGATRVAERWRPWRALAAMHLWLADGRSSLGRAAAA